MDYLDRIGWLLTGCLIGFVLGYLVRSVQDMKKELDEVDGIIKRVFGTRSEDHKDGGFMRFPLVADVAVGLALLLTIYGVIITNNVNNDVKELQEAQGKVVTCTQEYLARTIRALNDRTSYTVQQADANLALQKAQAKFLAIVQEDPPRPDRARAMAVQDYLDALADYIDVSGQTKQAVKSNPFPTNSELKRCLGIP